MVLQQPLPLAASDLYAGNSVLRVRKGGQTSATVGLRCRCCSCFKAFSGTQLQLFSPKGSKQRADAHWRLFFFLLGFPFFSSNKQFFQRTRIPNSSPDLSQTSLQSLDPAGRSSFQVSAGAWSGSIIGCLFQEGTVYSVAVFTYNF